LRFNTTGSLRGSRTLLIFASASGRSSVTPKKNRKAVIVRLSERREVPVPTRYNW
jgi:hypothetical protein